MFAVFDAPPGTGISSPITAHQSLVPIEPLKDTDVAPAASASKLFPAALPWFWFRNQRNVWVFELKPVPAHISTEAILPALEDTVMLAVCPAPKLEVTVGSTDVEVPV
jgi:hypothetical protein